MWKWILIAAGLYGGYKLVGALGLGRVTGGEPKGSGVAAVDDFAGAVNDALGAARGTVVGAVRGVTSVFDSPKRDETDLRTTERRGSSNIHSAPFGASMS